MEKRIGKVIHFFNKPMVAIIKLTDDLAIGDIIKFVHWDQNFNQKVESMQIEHEDIQAGKAGDEVAIKTTERAHENSGVYKILE